VLDEGLELHPLKEQRDSVRDWRQIGLGIMGLADMLIKMELVYGHDESIALCDRIASEMLNMAMQSSSLLADSYGSFPKFDYETTKASQFYDENVSPETDKMIAKFGLRNSQLLTIAPTGTLSTMLGISGGIEPIFANSYTRKTESLHGEDRYYKVYTPIVRRYMEEHSIPDELELPRWFITSKDLEYRDRIDMQATWQEFIDASISSTINVPEDFTVDMISNLYEYAHWSGLKGCTIYRENCSRDGILTSEQKDDIMDEESVDYYDLPWGTVLEADNNVIGRKRKLMTGCGSIYLLAFFDEVSGRLLETYITKGSSGTCLSNITAISRLISTLSRAGVSLDVIIDQLSSCGTCPSYSVRKATKGDTSKGASCPIAIGYALAEMQEEILDELFADEDEDNNWIVGLDEEVSTFFYKTEPCPECGEDLEFSGGCKQCKSCGWSKCS